MQPTDNYRVVGVWQVGAINVNLKNN